MPKYKMQKMHTLIEQCIIQKMRFFFFLNLEISCLFATCLSLVCPQVCPELTEEKNLILVLSLHVNLSKIYKTVMFALIFTHWNGDLVHLDSGSSWFRWMSGEVSAKGKSGMDVMCGQVFPQVVCLENCMRICQVAETQ